MMPKNLPGKISLTKENLDAYKKLTIWNQLPFDEDFKGRVIAQYICAFYESAGKNWGEFGEGKILDVKFESSYIIFDYLDYNGAKGIFKVFAPC